LKTKWLQIGHLQALWNEKDARRAGTQRADDRNNDLWIAAHAKAAGLTLVTNNEREFRRVGGLEVQSWAV
jgi:predicted nucleic acid-binding protein